MQRKATKIRARQKDVGVSILVWRFSKEARSTEQHKQNCAESSKPNNDKVRSLKQFWERLSVGGSALVT